MQTILESPPFDSEIPLALLRAKQCTVEDPALPLLGVTYLVLLQPHPFLCVTLSRALNGRALEKRCPSKPRR